MISISVEEILHKTHGRLLKGGVGGTVTSVTTDSRTVGDGALFAAICGEKADGHDYVKTAVESGAACVLVEKEVEAEGCAILVKNTVEALGDIARVIMERLAIPVVGITGSVGKTTTRDMTHAVMAKKFQTLKNENNFNNQLGVPLTVFRAEHTTEAAVIEMGMDHFGEIDALAKMVVPDVGVVTNIGMSHIEILGSQENIYKAKSEMFPYVKENGLVVLNGDDKILMSHKDEIQRNVLTVGVRNINADLVATEIVAKEDSVSFVCTGLGHAFLVDLPVPGEHNVLDALLAIGVGLHFDVGEDEIADALAHFSMTAMRMDVIKSNRITIINDCYNAAPDSVRAALAVLSKRSDRKVAILGDIACLGDYSYTAHHDLGYAVVQNGVDVLFTVGENARYIAEGAFENGMDSFSIVSVDTVEELFSELSSHIKENDVVLVKASRVMGLERVTAFLKENF